MYIGVRWKFAIALFFAVIWFYICYQLSQPWINDLAFYVGNLQSFFIIFFIALIPGFMYMFILISYVLDTRPPYKHIDNYPPISILIAAYNEQDNIQETIRTVLLQKYSNEIEIIVADDGSTDDTIRAVEQLKVPNLILLKKEHTGKADSANQALYKAKHDIVVCIDADTILRPDAIQKIVQRYLSDPPNTAAVAGTVLVKNSRTTFISRIQEWDYFLAITAIKRVQSLFQGTLVAQGAFSLFQKKILLELDGWPDKVGEDIVLSWNILKRKYRIGFCEEAIAYTRVPETYRSYFFQRSRWARGLIEAFREHQEILFTPRLTLFFIYWNLLFPIVDFMYLMVFVPSLIFACFGHFFIVGPATLAVIPLAFLNNYLFYVTQGRLLRSMGHLVRSNFKTLVIFVLIYQLIMVPATIHGYLSEILYFKKRW